MNHINYVHRQLTLLIRFPHLQLGQAACLELKVKAAVSGADIEVEADVEAEVRAVFRGGVGGGGNGPICTLKYVSCAWTFSSCMVVLVGLSLTKGLRNI